jgi:glycerol-3-phosphate O-acyltransferase / dihydroxyacetone phosphate acyltransferase
MTLSWWAAREILRESSSLYIQLIQAARRLYRPPGQRLTLSQVVELNKRFLHGYSVFKDEPRLQALLSNVLKYNRLLRDLGLRDHQVRSG